MEPDHIAKGPRDDEGINVALSDWAFLVPRSTPAVSTKQAALPGACFGPSFILTS